jgi:glutamine amidotransferase
MRQEIGLLKSPIGNLQSAYNALYHVGLNPVWVDEDFRSDDDLSHLIVPGVGHFGAVMAYLNESGFSDRIRSFAASGRPLLGICVGMQVLASKGTEGGETPGLGLIDARVERLPEENGLTLPHVGWNNVALTADHPVFVDIKPNRDFYFVHSYGVTTVNEVDSLGTTVYGRRFASIIGRDNVLGFQFHPEKSQANGLKLLENFCFWDGQC